MARAGQSREALCCCEYTNDEGETSHILACCCNCEALDSACDKCITCKAVPKNELIRLISTIEDRCRLPWCSGGGAVRIRLDVAIPVLFIPCCIFFATIGPISTVIGFTAIPLVLLLFHRLWSQIPGHHRSKLFYMWGLSSTLLMFYIFEFVVVGFREVLLWENMILVTGFGLMMLSLYYAKRNPGVLQIGDTQLWSDALERNVDHSIIEVEDRLDRTDSYGDLTFPHSESFLDADRVTWVDSRPIRGGKLMTWCASCQLTKTPRSGHCPVCEACVQGRDHHCVWIDSCIGAYNHRAFFFALVLFVVTGTYGSHLTLTTICTPTMYMDWFLLPNDCRWLYADFPTALSFVAACYTLIAVCSVSLLLIYQVFLISQNLTSHELHRAREHGWTVLYFYARNNRNNRGLCRNWLHFLLGWRKWTLTYNI